MEVFKVTNKTNFQGKNFQNILFSDDYKMVRHEVACFGTCVYVNPLDSQLCQSIPCILWKVTSKLIQHQKG